MSYLFVAQRLRRASFKSISLGIPMNCISIYSNPRTFRRKPWQKGVIPFDSFTFNSKKRIKKGINIKEKYQEIKNLFFKHCSSLCRQAKVDCNDVLQEVYKGILIRNKGKCPFDKTKSAFSTYVTMVAKCVTSNYINKSKRLSNREIHGKKDSIESSDWVISRKYTPPAESCLLAKEMRKFLNSNLQPIYDDMIQGYKASQISKKRGIEIRAVRVYISEIRNILKKQYDPERNLC